MITYIEDFVTGCLRRDVEKAIVNNPKWLWQYRTETSGAYSAPDFAWIEDSNTEDSPQLIHVVSDHSKDMELISPFIYKISDLVGYELQIQRIKANLLWPNALRKNPDSYHRPHSDHGRLDAKSLIYYVNDSDGDTVIFKNSWTGEDPGELEIAQRIRPKAGSAVLFDSTLYHCSTSPSLGVRAVLNFIFWPKESSTSESDDMIPPLPVNIPIGKGFHNL